MLTSYRPRLKIPAEYQTNHSTWAAASNAAGLPQTYDLDEEPHSPTSLVYGGQISCFGRRACIRAGVRTLHGNVDTQLDLFLDYANNVKLYLAFHDYFRKWKPPLLAIWGKHDPFFIPAGAEAFERDLPNAIVQFLDTGHFALETHVDEIAEAMRQFLASQSLTSPATTP